MVVCFSMNWPLVQGVNLPSLNDSWERLCRSSRWSSSSSQDDTISGFNGGAHSILLLFLSFRVQHHFFSFIWFLKLVMQQQKYTCSTRPAIMTHWAVQTSVSCCTLHLFMFALHLLAFFYIKLMTLLQADVSLAGKIPEGIFFFKSPCHFFPFLLFLQLCKQI